MAAQMTTESAFLAPALKDAMDATADVPKPVSVAPPREMWDLTAIKQGMKEASTGAAGGAGQSDQASPTGSSKYPEHMQVAHLRACLAREQQLTTSLVKEVRGLKEDVKRAEKHSETIVMAANTQVGLLQAEIRKFNTVPPKMAERIRAFGHDLAGLADALEVILGDVRHYAEDLKDTYADDEEMPEEQAAPSAARLAQEVGERVLANEGELVNAVLAL